MWRGVLLVASWLRLCIIASADFFFFSFVVIFFLLKIMFHIEKAHYIVDEMVANGAIVENNKANILKPLELLDKSAQKDDSIFSR
jgi:AP-4 complex subunit sigma-1